MARPVRWLALALLSVAIPALPALAQTALLNVSYDPTRELYRDINRAFTSAWQAKTGQRVTINMSHAGSGTQARAVLDGLPADVVTLALAADIDALAKRGLLAQDWQSRLPDNSSPYTSTIVFLVRQGNPKGIHDWPDLLRPGIAVITPNPKTSGGARWNFLAALGYAQRQPDATEQSAEEFMRRAVPASAGAGYRRPWGDDQLRAAGTRGCAARLGERGVAGPRRVRRDKFEIVYPSVSIRAEPPVALVDRVVDRKGTRQLAQAYLDFLYTKEGQEIAAKDYYRPRDQEVAGRYAERYPPVPMFGIENFGGWTAAQTKYFADGGLFDRIYAPGQ